MSNPDKGASAEAIQYHYDVSNEFYRLWLDPSLTYSCALWDQDDHDDMLEVAQQRKLKHHARWARVQGADSVLDVGSGWGAMLKHLVEVEGVRRAVGLTLSRQQADWVTSFKNPAIEVRLESWAEHRPHGLYDSVISIGSFEHFARADWDEATKMRTYRSFFDRCYDWLKPGGWLSLQTIAYGNIDLQQARSSNAGQFMVGEIFPESELPSLEQIVRASDGLFELVTLQNDRSDYERTCRVWCNRLTRQRRQVTACASEATVARYVRYLKLSAALFQVGLIGLLRIAFRRLDTPRRSGLHPLPELWSIGRPAHAA